MIIKDNNKFSVLNDGIEIVTGTKKEVEETLKSILKGTKDPWETTIVKEMLLELHSFKLRLEVVA